MAKGGWKGKMQIYYTLTEAGKVVMAQDIFGTKEFRPMELVSMAWKFVKANSTQEKRKS
jgi:hypothetical protein